MRSMTGYGRGEADVRGAKFSVELNSVNRKQSDIVINLPRDLAELEPRIRQAINENISRGRTNVIVSFHTGVMRVPEQSLSAEEAWPAVDRALHIALADLIKMREREGKHLAKDLIHRL